MPCRCSPLGKRWSGRDTSSRFRRPFGLDVDGAAESLIVWLLGEGGARKKVPVYLNVSIYHAWMSLAILMKAWDHCHAFSVPHRRHQDLREISTPSSPPPPPHAPPLRPRRCEVGCKCGREAKKQMAKGKRGRWGWVGWACRPGAAGPPPRGGVLLLSAPCRLLMFAICRSHLTTIAVFIVKSSWPRF